MMADADDGCFEALKLCVFQMADAFTALHLLPYQRAIPDKHNNRQTDDDDDWMLMDDAG
jgi:hypothetical protein